MLKKISGFQFFALLYLCRMFTVMTYSPNNNPGFMDRWSIIRIIIVIAIQLILFIPAYLLYKRENDMDFLDISKGLFGKFSYPVIFVFFAFFMLYSIMSLIDFDFFIKNIVFTKGTGIYTIIFMLLACAYAASRGLEAIARAGSIIFIFFIIIFLITIFNSVQEVETVNLIQAGEQGKDNLIGDILTSISNAAELAAVAYILPRVKSRVKSGIVLYTIVTEISIGIITFLLITIFGGYITNLTFKFYALSLIGEVYVIYGMHTVFFITWILTALLKISLYLYLSSIVFRKMMPVNKGKYSFPICIITTLVVSLICQQNLGMIEGLFELVKGNYLNIVLAFIIPLTVLLAYVAKKRKLILNGDMK